jgi:hypothetical protein
MMSAAQEPDIVDERKIALHQLRLSDLGRGGWQKDFGVTLEQRRSKPIVWQ